MMIVRKVLLDTVLDAITWHPRIQSLGQILATPSRPVDGATQSVAYELGKCFQLDPDHCLLVASLDEQGGGDKCVGNDAYVFSRLTDIHPDRSIPLNRPDPRYRLAGGGSAWMSKYPATGAFVPLDADQPGRGTGFLVSGGITYNADGTSMDEGSERTFEFIQLRWDGSELRVTERVYRTDLGGIAIRGPALSAFLVEQGVILAPFTTDLGSMVFRFEFQGGQWRCAGHGEPFTTGVARGFPYPAPEVEPSIQSSGGAYWIHTRGVDPVGRLYRSTDGLNYRLHREQAMHTVPQSLNRAPDGTLYLATNPRPAPPAVWLRNPLLIHPLGAGGYGEGLVVHDEAGIREDTGDSIPFLDHAVASTVQLEGRRRHLLWYRMCDLKERTAYACQSELARLIGTPKPRSPHSGLYCAELHVGLGDEIGKQREP
jgi:hypothetical protein